MVAPITSTVRLPLSPLHVLLPAGASTGLTVASVAVFNQIRAIDCKRLIKKLGEVDPLILLEVDEAIKAAFGLSASGSFEFPPTTTKAISESTENLKTGSYEE